MAIGLSEASITV